MNLSKLQSVLAKGGHPLGDVIFWQLADARVDRETFERLWSHQLLRIKKRAEKDS